MDLDAELDSLVFEISSGASSSGNSTTASTHKAASVDTEVDDLLAELDFGEEKVKTVDDFDALMAGFESVTPSSRVVTAAGKKPQIKRKGKYTVTGAMQDQELFTTLDDLETKIKTSNLMSGAKGTCEFCHTPILGDVLYVSKRAFHPEHVFCSNCQKRDPKRQYINGENDKILCTNCHANLGGFICAHCNEPILDKSLTAMGKKWHSNHFVCASCTKGFPDGKYFEKEGKPYCSTCFANSGLQCKACKKNITANGISAMGGNFHKECFGCPVCKKPFGPGFYQHDGLPYCEKHYLEKMGIPICGGCNEPISQGQFLNVMGKKWHPQHFICSMCMTPLRPDFKEKDGKPYCPGCFPSVSF